MPCYETVRSHIPRRGGRFINDVDQAKGRRVLFLGPELKDRLFGPEEAVGRTVSVRGVPFTVIGIMINKQQNGMYGGPDVNKASIPLSTFESIFGKLPMTTPSTRSADTIRRRSSRGPRACAPPELDPEDLAALHFWDDRESQGGQDLQGSRRFRIGRHDAGATGAGWLTCSSSWSSDGSTRWNDGDRARRVTDRTDRGESLIRPHRGYLHRPLMVARELIQKILIKSEAQPSEN
jgi:hypothetical protein